jgi:competence protein ComEA
MLTSDEQKALLVLAALMLAGALLGVLDTKEPRFLRLTLGDSLALGAADPGDSVAALPATPPIPQSGRDPARPPDPAAPGGPAATADPAMGSRPEKSAYGVDGKLNLNAAGADALEDLPGIGPKTAQRILDDRRAHGPYRRVSDLRRVKGIGPKTLARLLPHLTVGAGRDSTR